MFTESNFAEVFTDRKAAYWLRDKERRWYKRMAEWHGRGTLRNGVVIVTPKDIEDKRHYLECAKKIRVVRIALPGTYPQFQIPDRLERELRKEKSNGMKKRVIAAIVLVGVLLIPLASIKADGVPLPTCPRPGWPTCPK